MRGIDSTTLQVRDEAKLVEGRMLRFGTNEVVVGRAAARQFAGLSLGSEIKAGQTTWMVVGIFESRGSVAETEIWCDARFLQGAYRRGNSYQSVYVKLVSHDAFDALKDSLTTDPRLNVTALRETAYYERESQLLQTVIHGVGYVIAGLMGIGAVFGAVNTMYTAVASRTREIATLRALGFNGTPVVLSVLIEALLLSVVGGVIGALLAWVAFDGYQTSTMNFQTFSQVSFGFAVTPRLLVQGLSYAIVMGLVGGLFPAVRAARLPVVNALREL